MSDETLNNPAEAPSAEVTSKSAEAPTAQAAPKPRRTRARKAPVKAESADGVAAAAVTGDAAAADKPAAAAAVADAPDNAASDQPAAPKPRRTRARKASAEDASSQPRVSTGATDDMLSAQAEILAAAMAATYAAQDPVSQEAASSQNTSADQSQEEPSTAKRARRRRTVRGNAADGEGDGRPGSDQDGASRQDASTDAAQTAAQAGIETQADASADAQASAQAGAQANSQVDDQGGSNPEADQDRASRERRERRKRFEKDRKFDKAGEGSSNGNAGNGSEKDFRSMSPAERERERRRQRRERKAAREQQGPKVNMEELQALKVAELRARATELQIDHAGLKKAELVEVVYKAALKAEGYVDVEGVLDLLPEGYGFLRTKGYLPSPGDAYVGAALIRKNGLRKGDYVVGQTRPGRDNDKFPALQSIRSVNGGPLEELSARPKFADLTPIFPDEPLIMEHGRTTITARVIDLVSPIGKGQRGLIVSPPKAGKTTVLKDIAAAITANNPEVHLMCLLVDERPEEVTDMQRSIRGEVIASTFDMPTEDHITVSELVIERAKRLVEMGKDVVILLDSLTRLARAYNLAQPASGRILSGGVDSTALYPPKKFLGAARNIEGGGSLTILASALVETGSKMDEVIFEEFKGTGNMELKLDRYLADRRIFPAIDPIASGTRKEDLLLNPQEAPLIWAVRRILANANGTDRAMDMLIKSLKQTNNNQEFLLRTAKKAQASGGSRDNVEL
ncbi:MAG: transcription termination factor Rho [Eggerthellales bacterium]|nr:transcription termination factor Rho [Eggerthellales bacterium]